MSSQLRVLYVTRLNRGSTGFGYLNGFKKLGLTVEAVDTSAWLGNWIVPLSERILRKLRHGRPPENKIIELNNAIVSASSRLRPHITFFVGDPFILPNTLEHTAQYGLNFIHFQDDMFNPSCRTFTFFDNLPHWDCILVTRKVNIGEYLQLGVRRVEFVHKAYTPDIHRPIQPNAQEYASYRGDVAFIGNFSSASRADFLAELVTQLPGVKFNVWGLDWFRLRRPHYWTNPRRWVTWPNLINACNGFPLWFDDMSKAMNANKIVLGLLNHRNRDLHTSRTLEIPACGAFMLMKRTSVHLELFEEGTEAEYFESFEEAVSKIQYYLSNDERREEIARAGHDRCVTSNYSYDDRAKTVVDIYAAMGK